MLPLGTQRRRFFNAAGLKSPFSFHCTRVTFISANLPARLETGLNHCFRREIGAFIRRHVLDCLYLFNLRGSSGLQDSIPQIPDAFGVGVGTGGERQAGMAIITR